MYKRNVALFVSLIVLSQAAYSFSSVGKQAVSVSVGYPDGSMASLNCDKSNRQKCALKLSVGKETSDMEIDFSKFKSTPNFKYIALFGSSVEDFSLKTSVDCVESDNTFFKKRSGAGECILELAINNNHVRFGGLELRSYAKITIRDIKNR